MKAAALFVGIALSWLLAPPALAHETGCVEDAALHRPEVEAPQREASGGVVVRFGGDCESLEVRVRGVNADLALDVTLRGEERAFEVGTLPAGSRERKLVRAACEGSTLPAGVESVKALFGLDVVVKDREGRTVLLGRVPETKCEKGEPGEEKPREEPREEPALEKANSSLERPEGAPQREAVGGIAISRQGDREKFVLELGGLRPDSVALLYIQTEEGFALVDEIRIGERGGGEFRRDTGKEQQLPLGVDRLQGLLERRVQIRDLEGNVLLEGRVPAFEKEIPTESRMARAELTRPEDGPAREAKGAVGVWRKGERERFDVEVGGFGPETGLLLYIANGDEVFVLVDDLRTGERGGAEIVRDTGEGQVLPLEAESIQVLAGRRIEIRDLDGRVVLHGLVPTLGDGKETVRETEEHRDAQTGAKVLVRVRIDPRKGREKLSFDMRRLPRDELTPAKRREGAAVRVYLRDDSGTMVEIGSTRVRRRGRAKLRFNTKRGDALPLGAPSVRDLAGRGFEVRVGNMRVGEGFLPFF